MPCVTYKYSLAQYNQYIKSQAEILFNRLHRLSTGRPIDPINENQAMKRYVLLLPVFFILSAHAQVKDGNKTRQVEQLIHLKQAVTRKIDSLQVQLPELASHMENTRKKIEQLKKETSGNDRPDADTKEQLSKLSGELAAAITLADNLRKKFDTRLDALDKALNLQQDLEDKISALLKESNR